MGKRIEQPTGEMLELIQYTRERWYKSLDDYQITTGALIYFGVRGPDGIIRKPALKLHGYECAATIELNPKDKVKQGLARATIKFDGDQWAAFDHEERIALIDHELYHLEIVMKAGAPVVDDEGWLKLKMRRHDWQIGGFRAVVERHGVKAIERQQAVKFAAEYGQELFDFMRQQAVKPARKIIRPGATAR